MTQKQPRHGQKQDGSCHPQRRESSAKYQSRHTTERKAKFSCRRLRCIVRRIHQIRHTEHTKHP